MPIYGELPYHDGERRFAESLAALDDGRLHLWFDVWLPRVSNIDVVIWDEKTGVFCIETKAVPVELVEEFSHAHVVIRDRGRSRSPMSQSRKAAFELLGHLKQRSDSPPWLSSTVAWPLIRRSDWIRHWLQSDFPEAYEDSMIFVEDYECGLEGFRARLEWLRRNPAWGSAEPRQFVHDDDELKRFVRVLGMRASSREQKTDAEPASRFRDKLSLGTEAVAEAAQSLRSVIAEARLPMPENWDSSACEGRLDEILERLGRPFKLGVIGEFRAGKSSLVNALLGEEVALVREFECTFAPQRLYFADEPHASLSFEDGHAESLTIAAALERLLRGATEDNPERILESEIGIPAPVLESVEIWDAPGFGGSDRNAEVAERFAERVDAGLWVFNKDYIGQQSLDQLLEGLRRRGKLLIGAVNKCEDLFQDEYERLECVLRRAYQSIPFAEILPVSALLAKEPDVSRVEEDGYAVDHEGNVGQLIEVLRTHILSDPTRLSARAAAGDLRAVAFSLRDDIQRELLAERRRLYLYESQLKRSKQLLAERMVTIAAQFERGALHALHEHLIGGARQKIDSLKVSELQDPNRMRTIISRSINDGAIESFLNTYFDQQRPWLAEALREIGIANASEYEARLTFSERLQQVAVELSEYESETELTKTKRAVTVASWTGASLGALALAIPGPQWPFVALGVVASYLASRHWRNAHTDISEFELRQLRSAEWAHAIDSFLERAPAVLHPPISCLMEDIAQELKERLRVQIVHAAFGEKSPESRLEELQKLESLRQSVELLIQDLGNPTLELPAAHDAVRSSAILAAGDRTRAQDLVGSILKLSGEMIAITDGDFRSTSMPLLLEVPSITTIRLLSWQQPNSAAGEAFRIALSELRTKRPGTVHVVAPIAVGETSESLPQQTWIFVPGWAFRFNASLAEVFGASTTIEYTPFEDDGSLYQLHFGRWWDDNVEGYQAIQV